MLNVIKPDPHHWLNHLFKFTFNVKSHLNSAGMTIRLQSLQINLEAYNIWHSEMQLVFNSNVCIGKKINELLFYLLGKSTKKDKRFSLHLKNYKKKKQNNIKLKRLATNTFYVSFNNLTFRSKTKLKINK